MKRRDFLRSTGVGCAGLALSRAIPLFADTPSHAGWRTFEVTTRVAVLKPSGVTHIWLPAALIRDTPFQKTLTPSYCSIINLNRFNSKLYKLLQLEFLQRYCSP